LHCAALIQHLLAVIALVVATGGVSKAKVPDSEGLIHACVTPQTGEMRILDPEPGQSPDLELWKDFLDEDEIKEIERIKKEQK